jgi:hypothetical protein
MKRFILVSCLAVCACKSEPAKETHPLDSPHHGGKRTLTVSGVTGCKVTIDESDAGVTPLTIDRPGLGPHQVEILCPGKKPYKTSVIVDSNMDHHVAVDPNVL